MKLCFCQIELFLTVFFDAHKIKSVIFVQKDYCFLSDFEGYRGEFFFFSRILNFSFLFSKI